MMRGPEQSPMSVTQLITQLIVVIFPVLPLTNSVSLGKSVNLFMHQFLSCDMDVIIISYKNIEIIKPDNTCKSLRIMPGIQSELNM